MYITPEQMSASHVMDHQVSIKKVGRRCCVGVHERYVQIASVQSKVSRLGSIRPECFLPSHPKTLRCPL